jgi:photosystem II stability/assembly factor-like uncharacterized protein
MKLKLIFSLVACSVILCSCKSVVFLHSESATKVIVDTLLLEEISIRAIQIDGKKVWYGANQNKFGFIDLDTKKHVQKEISVDTSKFEFRCIAKSNNSLFIANVGSPAYFFEIDKTDLKYRVVHRDSGKNAFYDSMKFWNSSEGIAIGDPIDDCFTIVLTKDGGKTWNKIPCKKLPKTIEGEAAFAASNTTICIQGNSCWVVSGGKKARVFYTANKGNSWEVFETPIIQGGSMTGIFTADFYDDKIGFVAGGNYEKPQQNFQNKAITFDGGKSWKLVSENDGFGYASCVQFVPSSKGKAIVSVGATGLHYTKDFGNTWTQMSADPSLYTIRFISRNQAIAAGKNKVIRITFR